MIFRVAFLPPHTETDECEEDDDDSSNRSSDSHRQHLSINLTLFTVEVAGARAGAHSRVDGALTLVRAELSRTRLAVSTRELRIKFILVSVTLETLTREASEQVDTHTEVSTVIVLWLAALIEVLHARDGVEGSRDIQVSTADVVCSGLDHFNQFVLDVSLHHLGPGVRILLHLQSSVHSHRSVQREELVDSGAHVDAGERGESHG